MSADILQQLMPGLNPGSNSGSNEDQGNAAEAHEAAKQGLSPSRNFLPRFNTQVQAVSPTAQVAQILRSLKGKKGKELETGLQNIFTAMAEDIESENNPATFQRMLGLLDFLGSQDAGIKAELNNIKNIQNQEAQNKAVLELLRNKDKKLAQRVAAIFQFLSQNAPKTLEEIIESVVQGPLAREAESSARANDQAAYSLMGVLVNRFIELFEMLLDTLIECAGYKAPKSSAPKNNSRERIIPMPK